MTIFKHISTLTDRALLDECARRGLISPPAPEDDAVVVGGLEVDPVGCVAFWCGQTIALTGRETRVLYYLAKANWQGRRAERVDRLTVRIWHADDEATRSCLREAVCRLRRKLPGLIESQRNRGHRPGIYWLNLDAQEAAA